MVEGAHAEREAIVAALCNEWWPCCGMVCFWRLLSAATSYIAQSPCIGMIIPYSEAFVVLSKCFAHGRRPFCFNVRTGGGVFRS